MIIFENDGEIDPRVISTFGCNVKENTNPIGFFGTGLKYGLAVLMRTGHKVVIQSGETVYDVSVQVEIIRGKDFQSVVMISGSEVTRLGFTTDLGKTWDIWMAYRELFCNTKDENGKTYSGEMPVAEAGKTRVGITGEGFETAHRQRDEFILSGSPDFVIGETEVRCRPSKNFFYRGIKVMEFEQTALYTYNRTGHVQLTEDRTAKEPWGVMHSIARDVLEYAESPMLEKVLVADKESVEHSFDYHGWSIEPGKDFFPAVAKLQRHSISKINSTALRLWREKGGGFIDPRRVKPTKVQAAMLEKAIAFCEESGFAIRGEFPIMVVESLGENGTLAIADIVGKQILLTIRLFDGGTKQVARALIEEYIHLRFGLHDCSREMQNFVFDRLLTALEEIQGEPL